MDDLFVTRFLEALNPRPFEDAPRDKVMGLVGLSLPDDLREYVLITHTGRGGGQVLLKFPNGYGASIVKNDMSYGGNLGLFEIAVVKFDDKGEWHLNYDTPVTDDVIGNLSVDDAVAILRDIQALPATTEADQ